MTNYKRISVRRQDKTRIGETHDRIYTVLDQIFGQYLGFQKNTHKSAVDSQFYVDEFADNFLLHDGQFNTADIDIWLDDESLDVRIKVTHDGNDFDPLDPNAQCVNIRNAAARLTVSPQTSNFGDRERKSVSIKYNLKAQT